YAPPRTRHVAFDVCAVSPQPASSPTRRSSDLDAAVIRAAVLKSTDSPLTIENIELPPPATSLRDAFVTGPRAEGPTTRSTVSARSEEHTSELQSRVDLVCRLLLDKKKTQYSGA